MNWEYFGKMAIAFGIAGGFAYFIFKVQVITRKHKSQASAPEKR